MRSSPLGPGLEIRELPLPPTAAALAALGRFALESDTGAGLSPRGVLSALATRPGRAVRCWVAHRATEPEPFLGLVTLVVAGDGSSGRPSISWLRVEPRARRRGIGTALVAAALGHARALNAREVWAETDADWSTVGFWASAGFVVAAPAPAPLV